MKIKWTNVYYPMGIWQDLDGKRVNIPGNFRATFKGEKVLVIHHSVTVRGGHGESDMTDSVPMFVTDDKHLLPVTIDFKKDFIEVEEK